MTLTPQELISLAPQHLTYLEVLDMLPQPAPQDVEVALNLLSLFKLPIHEPYAMDYMAQQNAWVDRHHKKFTNAPVQTVDAGVQLLLQIARDSYANKI